MNSSIKELFELSAQNKSSQLGSNSLVFHTAQSKDENNLSGLRVVTSSTLKKEAIEATNKALADQAEESEKEKALSLFH